MRPVYRTKDGKRVPSVTTVISVIAKDYLIRWGNRLGLQGIDSAKYTQDAADIGTLAHAWVEAHLRGEKFPAERMVEFSEEQTAGARVSWAAYLKWRRLHEVEPLLIEAQLISERMKVGGTLDLYARIDGVLEVVDFKTSARVNDSHVLQLAAYRALLEENGHEVTQVRVVLLPREVPNPVDALLSYRRSEELERVASDTSYELALFEAARALYEAQRAIERAQAENRKEVRLSNEIATTAVSD